MKVTEIPIGNGSLGTVLKGFEKEVGRVGNERTNRHYPNYNITQIGGAGGVMVIVVENGHGDTSSNLGRD